MGCVQQSAESRARRVKSQPQICRKFVFVSCAPFVSLRFNHHSTNKFERTQSCMNLKCEWNRRARCLGAAPNARMRMQCRRQEKRDEDDSGGNATRNAVVRRDSSSRFAKRGRMKEGGTRARGREGERWREKKGKWWRREREEMMPPCSQFPSIMLCNMHPLEIQMHPGELDIFNSLNILQKRGRKK